MSGYNKFLVFDSMTLFGVWLAGVDASRGNPRPEETTYTAPIEHPTDDTVACEIGDDIDPGEMDIQSLADLDAAGFFSDSSSLAELKESRLQEIDIKTMQLLAQGFAYTGPGSIPTPNVEIIFSLSIPAQTNLHRLYTFRDRFPYPKPYNTLVPTSVYMLQDQAEVETIALAALTRVDSILSQGVQLRLQIDAATTIGQVDAIIDTRT